MPQVIVKLVTRQIALSDVTDTLERMTRFETVGFEVITRFASGDGAWIPPGEKHWHGATPTTAMTHIAIVEQLDGRTVDWMEKVRDEQYLA